MEVSNAQHHQRMGSKLEDGSSLQQQDQKRLRPNPEQFLRCPRCDSTNTKFCYYNNYSLSQPRYFCKGCRRYWTQGGSLRNVPVGGGCRKNKRSSSSSSCSSSSSTKKSPNLDQETTTNPLQLLPALPLPPLSYDPNELSLAFASLHSQQQPIMDHDQDNNNNNNSSSTFLVPSLNPDNPGAGFLDILRGGLNADSSSSNSNCCGGLYYGFGGGGGGGGGGEVECGGVMMLPFDGGLMNSTEAVTTTTTATTAAAAATSTGQASSCGKAMMDGADQQLDSKLMVQQGMLSQWPVGGGGDHGAAATGASLAVDPVLRDYWNGVGSSWHGIINSSLM